MVAYRDGLGLGIAATRFTAAKFPANAQEAIYPKI
jgi:hypothetical protein